MEPWNNGVERGDKLPSLSPRHTQICSCPKLSQTSDPRYCIACETLHGSNQWLTYTPPSLKMNAFYDSYMFFYSEADGSTFREANPHNMRPVLSALLRDVLALMDLSSTSLTPTRHVLRARYPHTATLQFLNPHP